MGSATADERKGTGVTLQTIADRLGVSRTTVSNAYGRPDQLAPDLRARILATAGELGYCGPNPAARSLRKGRSGAYALLAAESLSYAVTDPAAVLLLQGIAEVFDERGYSLLILPATDQGEDADANSVMLDATRTAIVDGCVVYSAAADDPRLAALIARRIPTVVVDGPDREGVAFVGVDDRRGAAEVAAHLAGLGHRGVAVIAFPLAEDDRVGLADAERQAAATFHVSRERLLGFRDGLTAAGIDWATVPVFECSVNARETGETAAGLLLDREPRPTALLCFSDQLALGALAAAAARGLRVPDDLSITGYDDVPAAAVSSPPLTTVRQPLREKGVAAARLLLEGAEPAGDVPRRLLPTTLVVRASTGSAPGEST